MAPAAAKETMMLETRIVVIVVMCCGFQLGDAVIGMLNELPVANGPFYT